MKVARIRAVEAGRTQGGEVRRPTVAGQPAARAERREAEGAPRRAAILIEVRSRSTPAGESSLPATTGTSRAVGIASMTASTRRAASRERFRTARAQTECASRVTPRLTRPTPLMAQLL